MKLVPLGDRVVLKELDAEGIISYKDGQLIRNR